MINYSYDNLKKDTRTLIGEVGDFKPDAIVAIARGGLFLGQLLGYGLGVRNVQSIRVESYDGQKQRERVEIFGSCDLRGAKHVLVVDDIVDSGDTMHEVLEYFQSLYPDAAFKSAALFYKQSASVQPDFRVNEATEWINFFWEADFEQ